MTGPGLPSGAELEWFLERAEVAMYRDAYDAIPPGLAAELGLEARLQGFELRLTALGFDHPFFNRVMGVGLTRSPLESLTAAAEHFGRSGIRRWMLQVLPHADTEEFRAACTASGMVKLRGWAKHLGPATVQVPWRTNLRVERIGRDRGAVWAEIVVAAFAMDQRFVPWFQELAGRDRWRLYLALDGETPVAAAALFLCGEEGVLPVGGSWVARLGQLNFAGTLESHRGRGAQSALVARRCADARALGVDWIVTETDEELPDRPNPSLHTMVRLGFPEQYVRANWGPPKPSA